MSNILGKRLAELRQQKDLSQRELASQLGMTRSAISMYELGKSEPNFDVVDTFADFFDVDIGYLLGYRSDPGHYPRHEEGVIHNATIVTRNPELVDLDEAYGHASEKTRYMVRLLLGMEPYDPEQEIDMGRFQK